MSDDGSIFNKNGIDTSAKSLKKYKKVMKIAKKSLKILKGISTKKQSKRGGVKILAAKATVKWLAEWVCEHPKIVKNIYTKSIILTKEVIKKQQENDGKLSKQTIKDIFGIVFFNRLPTKEIFKKDLKKIKEKIKGKFTKKTKTTPNPKGKN